MEIIEGYSNGRDHIVIDVDDDYKSNKCIFRVPSVLRRQNPEAYVPDVLSIGPFHHRGKRGKDGGREGRHKDFQLMERVKVSYLNEILSGMKHITLQELTAIVIKLSDEKNKGGFEQRARDFYAEPLGDISSENFIEMMIIDGCFLIQLFRKCNDPRLRHIDDPVFNMECMFHFLCHDLLILENQLPWFVIHILNSLTLHIYPAEPNLISILVLKAFTIIPSLKQGCLIYGKHLDTNKRHSDADVLHILDLVRASIIIPLMIIDEKAYKAAYEADFDPEHQLHTATALSNGGIKIFQSPTKHSIMDIGFEVRRHFRNEAVLEIPQLNVDFLSECLFRNLIAIEQCYHGHSNEITSYAMFMDNLISSKEDFDLLCKEKVIGNWMSDEDGCKFFSNLYKDIPQKKFYYAHLCKALNEQYYTLKQHQLGENTRQQLIWFSNPWNAFYVIVGIFLLQVVPTILQTFYTIKQYYTPSP